MRKKIIGILVVTLLIATSLSVASKICETSVIENEKIAEETDPRRSMNEEKSEVEPNPSGSVSVNTDKIVYNIGEPIFIIFKNNGPGTVSIGGPPVFQIDRFSFLLFQWQYMYPDWTHLMLIYVDSGNSWTENWDQKTSNHIQVPWGLYRVTVPYYDHSTNSAENATDFFVIL